MQLISTCIFEISYKLLATNNIHSVIKLSTLRKSAEIKIDTTFFNSSNGPYLVFNP